ncbi:hypothetical protein [Actinomadura sp. 6N118]|uniref:hypothetical protein n=1 Tax=Actinomadura sp. 6N118 TaxID=3375151 RepID=UPI003791AFB1
MTVELERQQLVSLVATARSALASCRHPGARVAAAVMTLDGQAYTGVQVRSESCSHCSTCAEPVALGAALASAESDIAACVAVVRTETGVRVWSPCGTCRELLRDLRVAQIVVAELEDTIITATPDELLPWP